MEKKIFWRRNFILLAILLGLTALFHYKLHPVYPTVPAQTGENFTANILLVPLDGRPPCRDFVVAAGKIAGCRVTPPPAKLQDYYSLPGETEAMRRWVLEAAAGQNALIISADQLLYGGLLAAREKTAAPEEREDLLVFFRRLRQKYPTLPVYVFSILPRTVPRDTLGDYRQRQKLLAYSRLLGRKQAGLLTEEAEIEKLQGEIPAEILQSYEDSFTVNTELNLELIKLTREGIITRLILGQDDGEKYSLANGEKGKLLNFLATEDISEERVFLTHGADEIALTALAEIILRQRGLSPKVYVEYAGERVAERIMPFMAANLSEVATEKIRLLGGKEVSSPEAADITLFVSALDRQRGELRERLSAVKRLERLNRDGRSVALVDLSPHFEAAEILLPLLLKRDFPVNELIAYAGWNTASNSLGTALAQATLFKADGLDNLSHYASNLSFLQNRLVEDAFYLKGSIDEVNAALKKAGYINTADLDLEHNYRWANALLRQSLADKLAAYSHSLSFRRPLECGVCLTGLRPEMSYPWPRTFEIKLETNPQLGLSDQ